MTEQQIKAVNATARTGWAAKAIVPLYVASLASPDTAILDYGAGPKAPHTVWLRERGIKLVHAHDIGKNFVPGVHTDVGTGKGSCPSQYDIVFASNVLNVLPDYYAVYEAVDALRWHTHKDGLCVFNYPREPRKSDISIDTMEEIAYFFFKEVELGKQQMFKCRKPRMF